MPNNHERTLRVVMVSARFPPLIGGTESHVADLARILADRGHEVTVVTTVFDADLVQAQNEGSVRVHRVRAWFPWTDVRWAPAVAKAIREHPCDLIHVQGYHTFVAPTAMRAAVAMNRPYVVSFHSGGHSSRVRRAVRPLHQWLIAGKQRNADRMNAVSTFEQQYFMRRLRIPKSDIDVITTGVSKEFLTERTAESHEHLILSVGRLVRYKGHHLVIDALPKLRMSFPDVRLRILGDGPDLAQLVEQARRLGVGDIVDIDFVPLSDRSRLSAEFGAASVVALLSTYESQGLAGLEAVAVGARVVVGAHTALEELSRYDGVRVVDPRRIDEIERVIAEQLRSPAPQRPTGIPSRAATASAIEQLYREVIAAGGSQPTTTM